MEKLLLSLGATAAVAAPVAAVISVGHTKAPTPTPANEKLKRYNIKHCSIKMIRTWQPHTTKENTFNQKIIIVERNYKENKRKVSKYNTELEANRAYENLCMEYHKLLGGKNVN